MASTSPPPSLQEQQQHWADEELHAAAEGMTTPPPEQHHHQQQAHVGPNQDVVEVKGMLQQALGGAGILNHVRVRSLSRKAVFFLTPAQTESLLAVQNQTLIVASTHKHRRCSLQACT